MNKKNQNNALKVIVVLVLLILLFFKDKAMELLGLNCEHDHFNEADQEELNRNDPYYVDNDQPNEVDPYTPPYAPENDINNDGVEDGYINIPSDWGKNSFMKVVTDVEDFERGNDQNLLKPTTDLNSFFNKQTGMLTLSKTIRS